MQNKKIVYIANIRLPTEKAHGVQIMNTCHAIAQLGREIELIVADREQIIKQDIFEYYNLPGIDNFKITKIKTIGIWKPYYFGNILQNLQFVFKLQLHFIFNYGLFYYKKFIIYSRDEFVIFSLLGKVKYIFWETHEGHNNIFAKIILKFITGLVCISGGLKDFYKNSPSLFLLRRGTMPILVAHDAVNVEEFFLETSKADARKEFGLDLEKKIVMYVGKLDKAKGADTFAMASKFVAQDIQFVAVGAGPEKHHLQNIVYLPETPYSALHRLLKASDVLVIPNTGKDLVHSKYTSPMKLFAYLASGVPIVSSYIPAIREVVSKKEVWFFEADNAKNLGETVKKVFEEKVELKNEKAKNAKEVVKSYTWPKRAESIMEFCDKLVIKK